MTDALVLRSARRVQSLVRSSGIGLYEAPATADSLLFYSPAELQELLRAELLGSTELSGLAVRTRAVVAKRLVAAALGYIPPVSFRRVNPRLPHPGIDVYAQQASNLQIWNQSIDAARRYVILVLDERRIRNIHVIAGADLANFDTTGKLTSKFQASRVKGATGSVLVSQEDTSNFIDRLDPSPHVVAGSPVAQPEIGQVLPIADVYQRLLPMVGRRYVDPGIVQERNRGTVIHREVCERLETDGFADNGQFPDILSQLVEVKLQLARTVDLGVSLPGAPGPLASANGVLEVRDVRYAIFYATRSGDVFVIDSLVVSTGADFFTEYRQFGGLGSNKKLQLRLPSRWFVF